MREGYHPRMEEKTGNKHSIDIRALIIDSIEAIGILLVVWSQMWLPRLRLEVRLRFPGGIPGGPFPFPHTMIYTPATFLMAALCILPLAVRRRYPAGVLVTVTAFTILYQALSFPPSFVILGVLLALYTAASRLDRTQLALWGGTCAAAVLIVSAPQPSSALFWADLLRTVALLAVATALGLAQRNRRAYVAEVERRAAAAERMAEEEARRRVDEERLRIARELHDITAHSLSIVAVQSGAALHVLDSDPAEARRSLEAIRDTSRSSLAELRAMLGVLRGTGEPAGAPLGPAPGLAHLEELAGPLRAAGLTVDVVYDPGAEPLPAIVDASAYRIVQEALTNVLRHAGQAHVNVRAVRSGGILEIEVADDGRSARSAEEGHGIAGMRERALALEGTFEAGPLPSGGWRVRARLPLNGRAEKRP